MTSLSLICKKYTSDYNVNKVNAFQNKAYVELYFSFIQKVFSIVKQTNQYQLYLNFIQVSTF